MISAKTDPRAFGEQHADTYQLCRAVDSDRLVTTRMPGSSFIAAESRETWYCDAAMNPFTHPRISQYLYASPEVAREHAPRISAVSILFAGRNWAVANKQDL